MSDEVIVIGGGIGGLSLAHHLVRAGVRSIHVYEAGDRVGGKARSTYVPAPAPYDGHRYPGEHGFRFFPHFYRHITDTMQTTPIGGETAWDRLVASTDAGVVHDQDILDIARPANLLDAGRFIPSMVEMFTTPGISVEDATRYGGRLLQFATSCTARRHLQYDNQSWADFAREDQYAASFRELVIKASRNLSAMRARESSAATIGAISLQMIFDFNPGHQKMDPPLCGPTDEAWLQPWYEYLCAQGVTFHFERTCDGFDFDARAGRIRGVRFGHETVTGRHYVAAIPLERIVELLSPEMCAFDPALANLQILAPKAQGDMTGVQFFLRKDAPIIHGHLHFPHTPFALTAVSQGQFWRTRPAQRPGTPELGGIISAIISDWDTPGTENITARNYLDRQALLDEVWRQMENALPVGAISRADVISSYLDQNISLAPFRNSTPLLVHPVGQRALRPDAETAISNLFLAADYVRTNTDLATMEGADEAARRAVRGILRRERIDEGHYPAVHEFTEGLVFESAKRIDAALFHLGLPHPMECAHDALHEAVARLDRIAHWAPADHARAFLRRLAPVDWANPDPDHLTQWEHTLTRR